MHLITVCYGVSLTDYRIMRVTRHALLSKNIRRMEFLTENCDGFVKSRKRRKNPVEIQPSDEFLFIYNHIMVLCPVGSSLLCRKERNTVPTQRHSLSTIGLTIVLESITRKIRASETEHLGCYHTLSISWKA